MTDIIWMDVQGRGDVPHIVTERNPCEMVVASKDGKSTRYSLAGYTAVHVREATADEVEAWRAE